MKRRYKKGDWFAVPLGSGREVVGVIAGQDRSRLFGYFFALAAGHPDRAQLETLQPSDAIWCGCFLGDALEDRRWRIVARTSVSSPERWALPPSFSSGLEELPDARFEPASLIETRLRGTRAALSVREIRSPFDATELAALAPRSRVQFGSALDVAELETLAAFFRAHAEVELRIHGHASKSFDASNLARFAGVKHLILDVALASLDALEPIAPWLETLTLGRHVRAPFAPPALPRVRRLELHGKALTTDACSLVPSLRELLLVDAPLVELSTLLPFTGLEHLAIRFGPCASADALGRLERLQHLELRGLRALRRLPEIGVLPALRTIVLAALPLIRDVEPLARSRTLERVEILAMEQLHVDDLHVLRALSPRASFAIDIGGRRKNREVYRWLQAGTSGV